MATQDWRAAKKARDAAAAAGAGAAAVRRTRVRGDDGGADRGGGRGVAHDVLPVLPDQGRRRAQRLLRPAAGGGDPGAAAYRASGDPDPYARCARVWTRSTRRTGMPCWCGPGWRCEPRRCGRGCGRTSSPRGICWPDALDDGEPTFATRVLACRVPGRVDHRTRGVGGHRRRGRAARSDRRRIPGADTGRPRS